MPFHLCTTYEQNYKSLCCQVNCHACGIHWRKPAAPSGPKPRRILITHTRVRMPSLGHVLTSFEGLNSIECSTHGNSQLPHCSWYCKRSWACTNRENRLEHGSIQGALLALQEPENLSCDRWITKIFCKHLEVVGKVHSPQYPK